MFRCVLLSNTTISPLVHRLRSELRFADHDWEIFSAEYGAALQQIFSENGELLTSNPDLIVLHLDLQQIKPDLELSFVFETPSKKDAILAEVSQHVVTMVKTLRSKTTATILVNNFPVAPRSVLGISLDHVFKTALRRTNLELDSQLRSVPRCHVLDLDGLWAEAGWADLDRRFEAIAQIAMGPKMQKLLVSEWLRYFRAFQGLSRKCVVVDLDNTLWRGIIGEDGIEGIQMGDTPEGRAFRKFQLALKALTRRGVSLAINSKNTFEDAIEVIRNYPDMVLRESDFAAMQINWDDKATNLARIVADLNIAFRHVVFLDDSPTERAWVRDKHPEVLVPEMPRDSSGYCDVLMECGLDTLTVTDEDYKRTKMYREERQRRTSEAQAHSYDQFLSDLNLEAEVQNVTPQLSERAAQLCQRTNQFNLATRRYTSEHIRSLSEVPGSVVLMIRARDRFGEYGWSGLAIANVQDECLTIDSFLLSCRLMGKNVEFALFAALVESAEKGHCSRVRGVFIPTGKNKPCSNFYKQCGMVLRGSSSADSEQWFSANLVDIPPLPIRHIKLSIF